MKKRNMKDKHYVRKALFINGEWREGQGKVFSSLNPYSGKVIWEAKSADNHNVDDAFSAAQEAFFAWRSMSFSERQSYVETFGQLLEKNKTYIANCIGQETGKPLWESMTEVAAMVGKIGLSIQAHHERSGEKVIAQSAINGVENTSKLHHRPHGVVAVFGPYNFPGHLPNGHIVPALLAGNTIVLKPSEQTPLVSQEVIKLWQEAGLPDGVLNLVQGAVETGESVAQHAKLNALLFTGSARTGLALHKQFAGHPEKMLALELGGNNPLIVGEICDTEAAVHDVLFSAFVSAGQRCTCARRLFVPKNERGDELLKALIQKAQAIQVGAFDADPQPFMGTVISESAAQNLLRAQSSLLEQGAESLLEMKVQAASPAMLSPGILDVSEVSQLEDEEHFGPLLKVIRYSRFEDAIDLANRTRFGLSAGLLSDDAEHYRIFQDRIRAGIVNWNKPITGASSAMPFGGIGISGNHRPSAYYAADYCAYPVASMEANSIQLPENISPGLL